MLIFLIVSVALASFSLACPTQAQFMDSPSQSNQSQAAEGDPFENFVSIVHTLFAGAFLFSLLGLIIASIRFIVAGGNEKVIGSANSLWLGSLIGLGIALAGYVIINVIRYYLR